VRLTFWQRLDLVARQMVPFVATLLLVMMALVPLQLPNVSPVVPWFALIAVFYWTVHRADLMPPLAVFGIGIFHDFTAGTNVGVAALLLLLVQIAVMPQRRFFLSRSFAVTWIGFTIMAAGAMVLLWLLNTMLEGGILSPKPAMFQFLTTVAAYPPTTWLFTRVQRWLLRA
jgi:rod shape-determining protein MreD